MYKGEIHSIKLLPPEWAECVVPETAQLDLFFFVFFFHGVGGMVGRGGSAQLSSSEMSGLVAEVGSVLFQVLGSNPKLLRLVLASRHCVAGIECSAQGPYTCMHRGSDWVSRDLVEPQDPKCCVPCKLN